MQIWVKEYVLIIFYVLTVIGYDYSKSVYDYLRILILCIYNYTGFIEILPIYYTLQYTTLHTTLYTTYTLLYTIYYNRIISLLKT